jgi:WD40 repeat protein
MPIRPLQRDSIIRTVASSSDGMQVAYGAHDHDISLSNVDLTSGTPTRRILEGHSGYIYTVTFSSNNKLLASCSSDAALIWDTETGALLSKFDMPKRVVWDVAFSPDCTILATASSDCLVRLWDVNSIKYIQSPRLLQEHSSAVTAVVFSPNGRLLVSGTTNGSIRLWDTTSWTMQDISASSQKIHAVAFSPDSKTLASCTEYGRITLYTASTERRLDDDGPWRISIADLTGYTFH